jgi:hypothetical protein
MDTYKTRINNSDLNKILHNYILSDIDESIAKTITLEYVYFKTLEDDNYDKKIRLKENEVVRTFDVSNIKGACLFAFGDILDVNDCCELDDFHLVLGEDDEKCVVIGDNVNPKDVVSKITVVFSVEDEDEEDEDVEDEDEEDEDEEISLLVIEEEAEKSVEKDTTLDDDSLEFLRDNMDMFLSLVLERYNRREEDHKKRWETKKKKKTKKVKPHVG